MTAPEMQRRVTVEEFEAFVNAPEHADQLFELIDGEIAEVPSNPYSSHIASKISFHIQLFLHENNIKGYVTGEAGGYIVNNERYAPDVAYISTEIVRTGYNPNPPQLAVEVISPTDSDAQLRIKMSNYLAAKTVLWIVSLDDRTVEIYEPATPARVLTATDTLTGGAVLPGFELAVNEIFPSHTDDDSDD